MMTREQMIDDAVRGYMEYLDANHKPPCDAAGWANDTFSQGYVDYFSCEAIRFAYWRIKNKEEFRNR